MQSLEPVLCSPLAGTHDNGTAVGWWEDEASDDDKAFLKT